MCEIHFHYESKISRNILLMSFVKHHVYCPYLQTTHHKNTRHCRYLQTDPARNITSILLFFTFHQIESAYHQIVRYL